MTPMTSTGWPSSSMVRASIDGSRPNRAVHVSWPRRATGAAPGAASSSLKGRPMTGWTRRTRKISGLARTVRTRAASSAPVRFAHPSRKAAVPS